MDAVATTRGGVNALSCDSELSELLGLETYFTGRAFLDNFFCEVSSGEKCLLQIYNFSKHSGPKSVSRSFPVIKDLNYN